MNNTKITQEKIAKAIKQVLMGLLKPMITAPPPKEKKVIAAKRPKRIIAIADLPAFMQVPELKGVCVGSCIYNGKWSKKIPHSAHAHLGKVGKYYGWICFETEVAFQKETTCQHELAHIITGKGHTKTWAQCYEKLASAKRKWLTVEWLKKKYRFKG